MSVLTVALPKGRVLRAVAPLFARAGADSTVLLADDRTLVRESPSAGLRFLLLKPDDVPTYVEYGAADVGVCGRDVLLERACEVYQPLDLGVGRCRMVVAGIAGRAEPMGVPRVATKYPRCAAQHFARRGVQAEVIYVQGFVELAPITGFPISSSTSSRRGRLSRRTDSKNARTSRSSRAFSSPIGPPSSFGTTECGC